MYGRPHDPRGRLAEDVQGLVRRLTVESDQLAHVFAEQQALHSTDFQALIRIMDAERVGVPLTPGELGTALRLSSGATTAVVDRLERQGHIRRDRDDADRRKVHLRFADRGMTLSLEFFGGLRQTSTALMARFSDDELTTIHRFMAQMSDLLSAHGDAVGR